ncbi:hypothetical protein AAC387_Pa10g0109 [Persea americana]
MAKTPQILRPELAPNQPQNSPHFGSCNCPTLAVPAWHNQPGSQLSHAGTAELPGCACHNRGACCPVVPSTTEQPAAGLCQPQPTSQMVALIKGCLNPFAPSFVHHPLGTVEAVS